MKSILHIFLFFLLIVQSVYSQWTNQNPVPEGNHLESVFFIDDYIGWVVGSDGFVMKTTNTGLDWIHQNSGTNKNLKEIKFFDAETGWAVGDSGIIIKTTNGGLDWTSLSSGITNNLWSLHFLDSDTGWVVGWGGTILKTTNGGTSWISQNIFSHYDLFSVCFVNDTTGWAVGVTNANNFERVLADSFLIVKTTNAGENWFKQGEYLYPNETSRTAFLTVEFIDENNGFVGGGRMPVDLWSVAKTANGGEIWSECSLNPNESEELEVVNENLSWSWYRGGVQDIIFNDINNGFCVKGSLNCYSGHISVTTNGGEDWVIKYSSRNDDTFNSIFVTDNGVGFAVEFGGRILISQDNGTNWVQLLSGNFNEFIRDVDFVTDSVGWAVGCRYHSCHGTCQYVIYKTTNSGKIWESKLLDSYPSVGLATVYFYDELRGWANGDEGLYTTTDGGENWIETYNGLSPLTDVYFINPDTGWAANTSGILKSTDGGVSWIQKSFVNSSSVYFIDEYIGWVVGPNGSILKSTDSGETWNSKTSGTSSNLNFVRFYNTNIGICFGDSETVLVSTDGGENWASKTGPALQSINFINSTTVWGATAAGELYKTTDFGDTWISQNTGIGGVTSYFVSENKGWVAENNNIFLYYTEPTVPTSPTNLTAIADTFSVDLQWIDNSSNEIGFIIERKDGDSLSVNQFLAVDTVMSNIASIADSGLTHNTTYTYRVFAYNDIGNSTASNLFQVITLNEAPLSPTELIATADTFSVVLNWVDNSDNELGFVVERKDGDSLSVDPFEGIDTVMANITSVADTGLLFNSTYTYRLFAYNSVGNSDYSNIRQVTTNNVAPAAPINLAAIADTFSVTLNWTDNSSNEIGFVIERKDGDSLSVEPFVSIDTVMTDITSVTDTGLFYNTTYTYRVFAYNIVGNSDYSNQRQITTYNIKPSAPANLIAIPDTFSVELSWTDNSDNESGFIIERKDGDSTGVNPFMIIDTVDTNEIVFSDTGLTSNTTYTYRVFAFNEIGTSTYTNLAQVTTSVLPVTFQLTVPVLEGWNLLSIPGLHPINQNVTTWWSGIDPTAEVFKYNGSYEAVSVVEPKTGYWMKNLDDQTYSTGDEWPANGIIAISHDAIDGVVGWNIIGGYEYNAAVSGITTTPPGLQNSPVYGYSGAYTMADYLIPGYGYWIKLSANGQINIPEESLNSSSKATDFIRDDWSKIIFSDALWRHFTLFAVNGEADLRKFELPPTPPGDVFDIRFNTGRIAEDINQSIQTIEMSGVKYPLTVKVEGMDIRLMDETGKNLNVNLKSGENVLIVDATIDKLMVTGELIPEEYSLEQNYPNPFNPSTVIEFSLPEDVSNVKLSIYNTLGEKVAELVDASLTAGKYRFHWIANNSATGIYIYELRSNKFISIKKMILLK